MGVKWPHPIDAGSANPLMSISLKQNPEGKIRESKSNDIQFPCQPTSPELAMEISSELAVAAIYRKSYSCHTKPLSGTANCGALGQFGDGTFIRSK
jgi:hypothetical protein